ncbi:MAG: hypothetical protein ACI9CE_003486 [Flavobacterium sp.]|jgi:hypothetical protein
MVTVCNFIGVGSNGAEKDARSDYINRIPEGQKHLHKFVGSKGYTNRTDA